MANVGYMVDTRNEKPDLVKAEDGVFTRYDPRVPEKWERSKFLDSFATGGGDWVWYDDITPEEAKEYMHRIDNYWKNKK